MMFVNSIRFLLMGLALGAFGATASAGERAQVDLSVSVAMTPDTFVPGGHNMFSVTVHNAGSDDAGSIHPDQKPIRVYGNSFVFPLTQESPVEIVSLLSGNCWIERYSEQMPNGNWVVQFIYYFDPIAADASRTCTSDIYFSAQAPTQIATNWRVTSSNDTDTNPSNNRDDYTFVAAPPAPAAPVPTGSTIAWLMLALGLLAAGVALGRARPQDVLVLTKTLMHRRRRRQHWHRSR